MLLYYSPNFYSVPRTHKSLLKNKFRGMGLTLSEPATAKDTASCQNATFKVGSSCMQGWRVKMEDAHTHILSLPDDPGTAFFAVYDGHGGSIVAKYAGNHLHKYITAREEYKEGDIAEALRQAFLEIDEAMLTEESLREEQAGCTAVAIVVKDNTVWCANVGDSRAVASVNGVSEPLSLDHKPNNEVEFNRIAAAGGFVEYNRVNGTLALSRALGDYVFKQNEKKAPHEQMVTAFPDIEERSFGLDWEFIVMACDGIWDVMTNAEVVQYVRKNMGEGMEPEEICENLMMKCLAPDCQMAGLGCDNMTVVIIVLLQGRTYEEIQKRCATKYQEHDHFNDTPNNLMTPQDLDVESKLSIPINKMDNEMNKDNSEQTTTDKLYLSPINLEMCTKSSNQESDGFISSRSLSNDIPIIPEVHGHHGHHGSSVSSSVAEAELSIPSSSNEEKLLLSSTDSTDQLTFEQEQKERMQIVRRCVEVEGEASSNL